MLAKSIAKIHSSSVIICSEEVEDLIYERISLMDTEILSYENSFVLIEGEEVWSNDHFQAFEKPINLVVNGQLTLDHGCEWRGASKQSSGIRYFGRNSGT